MINMALWLFADLIYSVALFGGIVVFLSALFLKPAAIGLGLPIPPGLIEPLRAIGKALGIVAALWGGVNLYLADHDAKLRDAWATEQREAVAAEVARERARGDAAALEAIRKAREGALADQPVREIIRRVQVTSACVANPGVSAAMRSLRAAGGPSTGKGTAPR